ncbi:hypothetical protein [Nocardia wallacei]|uniref:hypothetical protein n=1 Tax=Nocardia wallacei TaxID=480035 RepID=UPI002454CD1C|nr:hypothetical protein [Nocardia wallacei]
MGDDAIVVPPAVCGYADAESAHEQMRRHRECRLDRCVWKAAAYHTLVETGCLAPQSVTPREGAAARGIAYSPLRIELPPPAAPTAETLREVLDRLSELALPLDCSSAAESCREGARG